MKIELTKEQIELLSTHGNIICVGKDEMWIYFPYWIRKKNDQFDIFSYEMLPDYLTKEINKMKLGGGSPIFEPSEKLKEYHNDAMEKNTIGYKLKEEFKYDDYKHIVREIACNSKINSSGRLTITISNEIFYFSPYSLYCLRKAKVLDLWFDPVYKTGERFFTKDDILKAKEPLLNLSNDDLIIIRKSKLGL